MNPDQNTLEYKIGRWAGGQKSSYDARMRMSAGNKREAMDWSRVLKVARQQRTLE